MALSTRDRLELQELMARYAAAVDVGGSEEDLYEIFAPDAVLDSPVAGKFAGPDGLRQFAKAVAGLRIGRSGRHLITNIRLSGSVTKAEIKAYYISISTPDQPDGPGGERRTVVTGGGCYDCSAKKTERGWRLVRRTVHVDGK